ncbi:MAG TPA: 16S rRNA (cytidine(1402)-2'-O)-methyltransferase [Alphaproteobacteria bacterium]|nr:16S rRNA (cytidine(1402)-2'-O)-methyltransferase [Alphaproteobacteria bacterium]
MIVVATPIGNLGDITLRALEALREVDLILCEDSRVTAKLARAHGITTPFFVYHEHNADRVRPALIERLKHGESMALVSDAGTPLVSDPGYKLVRACHDAGIAVTVAPGASAVLGALVVAGLPTDRFFFAGFLPPKRAGRRSALAALVAVPGTLVFFESPRRLAESLADMADLLGERPAAVVRELTKLYEEVRRGSLAELAAAYGDAEPPKGEIVVVVGAREGAEAVPAADALDRALEAALARLSVRDATVEVAAALGVPRRQVYERALALAGRGKADEDG